MSNRPLLKSFVYVDEKWYGPEDAIPAASVEHIGAHCWVDGKPHTGRVLALNAAEDDGDELGGPPPMAGRGSGEAEWRAYAQRLEVTVAADAKRDDIVEAIKTAGHPVEPTSE